MIMFPKAWWQFAVRRLERRQIAVGQGDNGDQAQPGDGKKHALHPRLRPRRVSKKLCNVWANGSPVVKRMVSTPAWRISRSSSARRRELVSAYFCRTEARTESSSM